MHEYAHCGVLSFNKPRSTVYYVPGTMLAEKSLPQDIQRQLGIQISIHRIITCWDKC